jgi:SAM-dependent methyltransferase
MHLTRARCQLVLAVFASRLVLSLSSAFITGYPKSTRFLRRAIERRRLRQHEIFVDPDTVLDADTRAQLTELVSKRADARWNGDYLNADSFRDCIDLLEVPDGVRVVIQDMPRNDGGTSSWKLAYRMPLKPVEGPSVLNLAHSALGMAVSASERKANVSSKRLDALVDEAKQRLRRWSVIDGQLRKETGSLVNGELQLSWDHLSSLDVLSLDYVAYWSAVEVELAGRKAADAAFWFAMAGAIDAELYSLLTQVCTKEIERFGNRPSCRAKDLIGIVERLAAAGVRNDQSLEDAVAGALASKLTNRSMPEFDSRTFLNFHSDHCALMIWKFSTRQRKQRSFLQAAAEHWERSEASKGQSPPDHHGGSSWHPALAQLYADPLRPLVIDVGCGMGVSLLGLACLESEDCGDYDWSSCNFIGVDLSSVAIGYANGIARRWGLDSRLAFVVESAEVLLGTVKLTYPGPVGRILVQFPTPYRLLSSSGSLPAFLESKGNSQLPRSPYDGFMVSAKLLQSASELLRSHHSVGVGGNLILQSNCEDVAVFIRDLACREVGFRVLETNTSATRVSGAPTQRTQDWLALGGRRAEGAGWRPVPILPSKREDGDRNRL